MRHGLGYFDVVGRSSGGIAGSRPQNPLRNFASKRSHMRLHCWTRVEHDSSEGFDCLKTPRGVSLLENSSWEETLVNISVATTEDIAPAKAIAKAAFSELRSVYSPTKTAIANKQDSTAYVVAKMGQTVVGTLQYFDEGDRIYVFDVAVDANYRRQGIARRLIDFVSDTARNLGHKIVSTRTIRETGNVEIFEKLGFHVVKEETAKWCVSDRYPTLHDVYLECTLA